MLHLFKFIDSGFLLTLGLLLLIGGSIMLYCYRRLNLLERSIIEHGKILQNFIVNYNNQMNRLCLINKSGTNDGICGYEECDDYSCNITNSDNQVKKINMEKKINVSDDEKDEDDDDEDDEDDNEDDDDEDEDDEDDEDEEDDDEEDDEDEDDDEDDDAKNTKVFDIKEPLTLNKEFFETIQSSQTHTNTSENNNVELVEVSSTSNYLNNDDDIFIKNLPIVLSDFNTDLEISSKVITLENNLETTQKVEKKNYSKMRIDELRALVVTKNIVDNEEALKLKKNDLVKLLQK
jgi:hypothetical protein